MLFTKDQRTALNQLSKTLYGSESKWLKLLEQGQFNIPTGTREEEEAVDTVQLPGKGGKKGTILKVATALVKGLINGDTVPKTRKRTVTEFRAPTFEDMVKAFSTMIDAQKVSRLKDNDLIQVLAVRYVDKTLTFPLSLDVKDGPEYSKLFEDLLALVPADRLTEIKALVPTAESPAKGLPVDAFTFVTDFLFALGNPAIAQAQAQEAIDSVDLTPKKPAIPHAMMRNLSLDGGGKASVNPAVKAKRRTKNKLARKARRVNRSA